MVCFVYYSDNEAAKKNDSKGELSDPSHLGYININIQSLHQARLGNHSSMVYDNLKVAPPSEWNDIFNYSNITCIHWYFTVYSNAILPVNIYVFIFQHEDHLRNIEL